MGELRRVDDRGRILLSREDLAHLGVGPGGYVAVGPRQGYPGHGHFELYGVRPEDLHA